MNKKVVKSSVLTFALMMVMVFAMSITVYANATVTNLTQTADTDTSVTVEWVTVAEGVYYGVQIARDAGFTDIVESDCTKSTNMLLGGYSCPLVAGTSYYVRVGYGADRDSCYANFCAPIEVVTTPNVINGSAAQTNATTNSITVVHSGAVGANYYALVCDDIIIGESATSTITTAAILRPATSLWVYVYPCRISSTGYLAQGSYKYLSCNTLGKKISTNNFGCTNAYENINVYYFDAAVGDGGDVDGYHYQFANAKGKVKKNVKQSSGSLRLAKFINGTFYKYRVRTYVEMTDGTKKYSSWSSYRYIAIPKADKVKATISGKKIKLSWAKVSGVKGYYVYVSTKENSGYKKVATLSSKKTSYTVTKYNKKALKKGKTYYVKLVPYAKVSGKNRKSEINFYWECEIK